MNNFTFNCLVNMFQFAYSSEIHIDHDSIHIMTYADLVFNKSSTCSKLWLAY